MITEFFNRYAHWLFLLFVGLSIMMGMTIFTSSVQGIIAGVFGIVGFLGIASLVIQIEVHKRKKDQ